jgi:glycosyltransferase involved in cell wall biosynthesis
VTPKFSIVIPVYKRHEYLRQAIASCLKQTTPHFEVVVSDDCSSEDLRLVTEFYAITLHSDDLLLPECLEMAGAALDLNPAAAAVYFSCIYLSDSKVNGFQSCTHAPLCGWRDISQKSVAREIH